MVDDADHDSGAEDSTVWNELLVPCIMVSISHGICTAMIFGMEPVCIHRQYPKNNF